MKKSFLLIMPILVTGCGASSEVHKVATFPKYGNYCGLDRPATGENPSPTDDVDAACKNHDKCYVEKGDFNLICDTTLIAELKSLTPKNEIEKIARKSIISYFRNSPQKKLMEINLDNM